MARQRLPAQRERSQEWLASLTGEAASRRKPDVSRALPVSPGSRTRPTAARYATEHGPRRHEDTEKLNDFRA